jgi:hypothetical protein
MGAHGSVVGWGTVLQAGSVPNEIIGFYNWPNPSSCTVALGSTQPVTGMSASNFGGCKGWPVHKADNLTAVSEPIF